MHHIQQNRSPGYFIFTMGILIPGKMYSHWNRLLVLPDNCRRRHLFLVLLARFWIQAALSKTLKAVIHYPAAIWVPSTLYVAAIFRRHSLTETSVTIIHNGCISSQMDWCKKWRMIIHFVNHIFFVHILFFFVFFLTSMHANDYTGE